MRLIYADVADPILSHTQASQDLYDFHLAAGYKSDTYPRIDRAADSFSRESKILYTCGTFQRLAAVHVVGNQQHRRFSSTQLLTLLRNKQISFVGDSLGRQYYLDLAAELRPWQSYLQYGAFPQVHTLVTDAKYELPASIRSTIDSSIKDEPSIPLSKKGSFMRRYYASHNVTLLWCEDSKLNHFQNYRFSELGLGNTTTTPNQQQKQDIYPSHCDWSALLDSHVLVLSVGAWYKPLYDNHNADFFEDLKLQQRRFRPAASNYRSLFNQYNRHGQSAIFLWALVPHFGFIDEATARGSLLRVALVDSYNQQISGVRRLQSVVSKQIKKSVYKRPSSSIRQVQPQVRQNIRQYNSNNNHNNNNWPSQNYFWQQGDVNRNRKDENKMRFEVHGGAKMWSQLIMAAVYPPIYNQILRSIAREFRDEYLDVYRLSSLYLRHFSHGTPLPLFLPLSKQSNSTSGGSGKNHGNVDWSPETLRRLPSIPSQEYQKYLYNNDQASKNSYKAYDLEVVHYDSLHYCPGSLFRGAQFLLQAAIEYRLTNPNRRNHTLSDSHSNDRVPTN